MLKAHEVLADRVVPIGEEVTLRGQALEYPDLTRPEKCHFRVCVSYTTGLVLLYIGQGSRLCY